MLLHQSPTSTRHHRTVVAAAVSKPGRAAGRSAGSKYYQNYLRNRQAKGGQFLGPPQLLQQPVEHPKKQQQQQQKDSQPPQEPSTLQGSRTQQQQQPPPASAGQHHQAAAHQQQQQQQLLLNPATATWQQEHAVGWTNPARVQQLLQQCLVATATAAPPALSSGPGPSSISSSSSLQGQEQQLLPKEQQRRQQQQYKQPWQFQDYVRPELAAGLVPLLKPRKGVTVEPPAIGISEPLVQLPKLPQLKRTPLQLSSTTTHHPPSTKSSLQGSSADSSSTTTSAAASAATITSSSSSSQSSNTTTTTSSSSSNAASGRCRVLHVFWDVSSLHPGGLDPRVVVAQLRRVLGCYGSVAGMYTFGVQKLFNWIPEAFMLQYAPERLPGRKRFKRQAADGSPSQPQQQQQQPPKQLQAMLQAAAQSGIKLDEALGPLRCKVCGKLRSNYKQLHMHMVQRHKQPAPPLEQLLPAGALAAVAAATAAASSADRGGDGGNSNGRKSSESQPGSAASDWTWSRSDPWAMRNSSTRTLGRVTSYFNSDGHQFIPKDGHQISFKYVLLREGVEVRTVQRQARAVDAAVADALHQMLHEKLLRRTADEVQKVQDVLVVVSDKGTHTAVLQEARRAGVEAIAVCGKKKKYKGADLTLRWQWVVAGRYECAGNGQGDGAES